MCDRIELEAVPSEWASERGFDSRSTTVHNRNVVPSFLEAGGSGLII